MDVGQARCAARLSSHYDHAKGINVMHHIAMEEIAAQRQSELRDRAASHRAVSPVRRRHSPLRVRTGWTLVDVGLKLAIPANRRPATPSALRF
jgi:hypothetical protein